MKRRPRMLWLVSSPAGSPAERAAAAALEAAAADGWDVTVVLPWRSQGAGAGFAPPGEVVEHRSVELAFEHFAFRGELRRDRFEGFDRWWAVPRSSRLEPPLAAAFLAAAALEVARAERHAGIVLAGLPAAMVPILLGTRLRAHPQFEDLRTYWVVDDLQGAGWIEGSILAELGLPEGLRAAPFGDGSRVSALRSALYLCDGLLVPPARGIRDSLLAVAEGTTAEALTARPGDLLPFPWALAPPTASAADASSARGRSDAKRAAQRVLGLPDEARAPLVVAVDPSAAARTMIEQAMPAALRQRAQWAWVDSSKFDESARETVLSGADLLVSAEPWDAFGLLVARALRHGVLPVYFVSSGAAHAAGPHGFPFRAFLDSSLRRALGAALTAYRSGGEWKKLRERAVAASSENPWPGALKRWRATWKEALDRSPRRIELPSPPPLASPPSHHSPLETPPQEVFIDWGPGLPERYQEDTIALLVQSPRALYAYWDVGAESRSPKGGYRLRLRESEGEVPSGSDAVSSESGVEVGEWGEFWILAEPDRRYFVELTTAEGDVRLRSDEVRTPPELRSPRAQVTWFGPSFATPDPIDPVDPIAPTSAKEAGTPAPGSDRVEPPSLAGPPGSPRAPGEARPLAEPRVGRRGHWPPASAASPPNSASGTPREPRRDEPRLGGSSEQNPRPPDPAAS